jgi:tRNA(fMet)-specific endonuclease VapC
MVERHVKLFKNGRNQAVRIPREFELPGEDVIIRKEGQRLIIEPAPPKLLLAVLATLPTLEEEFPPIEDLPAEPGGSVTMGFPLDTNVLSDVVRRPRGGIADHIAKIGEHQVCTSIIVAAELRYGAARKASSRLSA